MKAEACEIRAETRLRTSHTEVGRHCEPKAAADGGAVYGRYNRFFGAEEPVAFDIERGDAWPGSSRRRPCASSCEPSPKLAPAQKALPCAASTTTRMLPSSSKFSKAPAMSLINGISKKLFGGRLISTKATWPRFLISISLIYFSPIRPRCG